jgi:hypothetical protein
MSIFASRTTKVVEIPFDPPQTVTIQKLAGRHLEKARQAQQAAAVDTLQRMGGSAFQRDMAALGDPAAVAKRVAAVQADPLNGFDRAALLQAGIKAWTYDEPVTPASFDDLSEEAVDYLAREILKLTKPALFRTGDEQEAEKKTASVDSSLA